MKYNKKDLPFQILNTAILGILALTCILPFIQVLAVSLSEASAVSAGKVNLIPVGFNLEAYKVSFSKPNFINSMNNSFMRLFLGVSINTLLTILTAYPLSKTKKEFPGRTFISWIFVTTMLISGGLVPLYIIVNQTGINNSIWALILPYATPVFNVTILLNFFRGIPKEIEESAVVDGAGSWRILWVMYVPLSKACLATLVIFQAVFHWNEWFWGLIFIDKTEFYPLATYMRNVIANPNFETMNINEITALLSVSNRSFSAAQIIIGSLPILIIYPLLQKYFVLGLTVGAVKE
jgi:putative aldouronate transport system permease protein